MSVENLSDGGVVYGRGEHLPAGEDIPDFHELILSSYRAYHDGVYIHPDYPDSVLRLQYASRGDLHEYWQLVQLGITHFDLLEHSGISIPAQRFVTAPSPADDKLRLYTFTEKLEGRHLQDTPADANVALPTISGLSRYLMHHLHNPGNIAEPYLYDIFRPPQHTLIRGHQQAVLHDMGLEFTERLTYLKGMPDIFFCKNVWKLINWADAMCISPPQTLSELREQTATISPELFKRAPFESTII